MAQRLADGLWRLAIPLVGNPLKELNSYLLLGGERHLLIDTGFDQVPCWEAMDAQLTELGVDRARLDIFLTHLHSDHTGLMPRLAQPGSRVYISAVDGPLLEEGLHDDHWQTLYRSYVREGFSWEEIDQLWKTNPAQCAAPRRWDGRFTFVGAGDVLRYGGRELEVLSTPGHTPGHLCLYERREQWLFSGDHVLFHITPNICRWATMPDALGSYLESLERLRPLPVRQMFPAHRLDTGALVPRIDELEAHHARRLQNTLDVLAGQDGLTAYEIAGRMAWSIRARTWEDFPLNQKFFAVGETLAHLDRLAVLGQVTSGEQDGKMRYRLA